MRDSLVIMAVGSGPEPRTSTSRPLLVAVIWMSSGLPIEISGSAMAQAASSAPSRCGSRIGQRSIGMMSCEPAAAKPTLSTSCVPIRACRVMRRRPAPWASTSGATSQSIPPAPASRPRARASRRDRRSASQCWIAQPPQTPKCGQNGAIRSGLARSTLSRRRRSGCGREPARPRPSRRPACTAHRRCRRRRWRRRRRDGRHGR